jgi:hypothetical protein
MKCGPIQYSGGNPGSEAAMPLWTTRSSPPSSGPRSKPFSEPTCQQQSVVRAARKASAGNGAKQALPGNTASVAPRDSGVNRELPVRLVWRECQVRWERAASAVNEDSPGRQARSAVLAPQACPVQPE